MRLLHASRRDVKACSVCVCVCVFFFFPFPLFVLASFWFLINCMSKMKECKLSLKCSTLNFFNYGF